MIEKIVTSIGSFSYRHRRIIALLALTVFICVAILQSHAIIEYSYAEDNLVADIFPQDDTLLIVCESDESAQKVVTKINEFLN